MTVFYGNELTLSQFVLIEICLETRYVVKEMRKNIDFERKTFFNNNIYT